MGSEIQNEDKFDAQRITQSNIELVDSTHICFFEIGFVDNSSSKVNSLVPVIGKLGKIAKLYKN